MTLQKGDAGEGLLTDYDFEDELDNNEKFCSLCDVVMGTDNEFKVLQGRNSKKRNSNC